MSKMICNAFDTGSGPIFLEKIFTLEFINDTPVLKMGGKVVYRLVTPDYENDTFSVTFTTTKPEERPDLYILPLEFQVVT